MLDMSEITTKFLTELLEMESSVFKEATFIQETIKSLNIKKKSATDQHNKLNPHKYATSVLYPNHETTLRQLNLPSTSQTALFLQQLDQLNLETSQKYLNIFASQMDSALNILTADLKNIPTKISTKANLHRLLTVRLSMSQRPKDKPKIHPGILSEVMMYHISLRTPFIDEAMQMIFARLEDNIDTIQTSPANDQLFSPNPDTYTSHKSPSKSRSSSSQHSSCATSFHSITTSPISTTSTPAPHSIAPPPPPSLHFTTQVMPLSLGSSPLSSPQQTNPSFTPPPPPGPPPTLLGNDSALIVNGFNPELLALPSFTLIHPSPNNLLSHTSNAIMSPLSSLRQSGSKRLNPYNQSNQANKHN